MGTRGVKPDLIRQFPSREVMGIFVPQLLDDGVDVTFIKTI